MFDIVLVRYGEIGLRGNNRRNFEDKLMANMERALSDIPNHRIYRTPGRVYVDAGGDANPVLERLARVFGIVSFSPAVRVEPEMDAIKDAAEYVLRDSIANRARLAVEPGAKSTFKVESRRADKRFPLPSPEISREVGAHLLDRIGGDVDVHRPDTTVNVEVRDEAAFVYARVVSGPGGLPVGTSGKALLLLSGGIDSPVAGWMGLKRGIELAGVHFHSPPFTSERSRDKVEDICRVLCRYAAGKIRLHHVYFTGIQKAIKLDCPEEIRVTLMRRMMFRLAEQLAKRIGALALITGESVGQVASQTLASMLVINRVTAYPVLRPLSGMDKTEITRIAEQIGTYEMSIRPYEDCCTLFLPRHPKTRPHLDQVESAEEALDIPALMTEALDRTEIVDIRG